ncbi:hypothetical protein BC834DRAFT_818154, partial [Gloeopeniophorella convolvens]
QPSTSRFSRPWFNTQPSTREVTSYQSGGIPTWDTAIGGGAGADEEAEAQNQNQWETRLPMRVDIMSAGAYLLGPVTAFFLLAFETQNDYVRFHAYQSALLTTPMILLRILMALLHLPSTLQTLVTVVFLFSIGSMAYRAYDNALHDGLARHHIPFIGHLAERWLAEE